MVGFGKLFSSRVVGGPWSVNSDGKLTVPGGEEQALTRQHDWAWGAVFIKKNQRNMRNDNSNNNHSKIATSKLQLYQTLQRLHMCDFINPHGISWPLDITHISVTRRPNPGVWSRPIKSLIIWGAVISVATHYSCTIFRLRKPRTCLG